MVQTPNVLTRQRAAGAPTTAAVGRRRSVLGRFSAAHGLMIVSGLLAFVLVAVVTADRRQVVHIAVARDDIASGVVLRQSLFTRAELPADSELADGLVPYEELADGSAISDRAVSTGDALRRSDLSTGGDNDGLRSVSIPVARAHAAGGAIEVGDRVDVIDVVDGSATFVVSGAEVARVPQDSASGGITGGATQEFHVVVLVDAAGALAIAEAVADGTVDVVLSTNAAPVTPITNAGGDGNGDG
jgi:Flp pilus assembly protein CpaB